MGCGGVGRCPIFCFCLIGVSVVVDCLVWFVCLFVVNLPAVFTVALFSQNSDLHLYICI